MKIICVIKTFSSHVTGGVLGLCTGMSILSLCELVYWLLKAFRHLLRQIKPSRKRKA